MEARGTVSPRGSSRSGSSSVGGGVSSGSGSKHHRRRRAHRFVQTMRPIKARTSDGSGSKSRKSHTKPRMSAAQALFSPVHASHSTPAVSTSALMSVSSTNSKKSRSDIRRPSPSTASRQVSGASSASGARGGTAREQSRVVTSSVSGVVRRDSGERDREHLSQQRRQRRHSGGYQRSSSWNTGDLDALDALGEATQLLRSSEERDRIVPLEPEVLAALAGQVCKEGSRTSSPARERTPGGTAMRVRAGSDEGVAVGGGRGGGGGVVVGSPRLGEQRRAHAAHDRLLEITRVRSGSCVTEFNPLFANRKVDDHLRGQRDVSPVCNEDRSVVRASISSESNHSHCGHVG
jgi:hypothetical protein